MLRAHQARCAALIGNYSRTAEYALQCAVDGRMTWSRRGRWFDARTRGWWPWTTADTPRNATPRPAPHDSVHRAACCPLGARGWSTGAGAGAAARACLHWPVGAAERSRVAGNARARCRCGHGPGAVCRWCGRAEPTLRCARGSDAVRAVVVGARRTAEELGRAFADTPVITSAGDAILRKSPLAGSGSRHPEADPGHRVGMGQRCSWTPGRCWAGKICVRPRMPCGAGCRRPHWCEPAATAAL
jgi:primosomal protein N' (replication factor Y)